MSAPAEAPAPAAAPASISFRATLIKVALLVAFAVCLAIAANMAWQTARVHAFLRTQCLVALIIAGIGITACLAGVFHYLDQFVLAAPRRWYVRWPFFHLKQILLVLELGALAISVYAALVLLFDFKFP